jgi:hypothetical protein
MAATDASFPSCESCSRRLPGLYGQPRFGNSIVSEVAAVDLGTIARSGQEADHETVLRKTKARECDQDELRRSAFAHTGAPETVGDSGIAVTSGKLRAVGRMRSAESDAAERGKVGLVD